MWPTIFDSLKNSCGQVRRGLFSEVTERGEPAKVHSNVDFSLAVASQAVLSSQGLSTRLITD